MDSEETKNESEVPEPKKSSFWSETWDFIRTLVISMICVFLVAHFLARPIRVQGNSMYPTLESESVGLANVLSVEMGDLNRFDIAIIYLPEKKEYLVKRIIGLPGETVSYTDGQLYINGEPVDEPFLNADYTSQWGDEFMSDVEPITLGEDEYYCLGDNRPNSRDSRYYGPFTNSQIIAKGALILWPFSDFGVKSW